MKNRVVNSKFVIIIFLIILIKCQNNHSDIEICFENFKNRIGSDSILNKLMYSSIDSYGDFASILSKASTEDSSSICKTALDNFLLENKENSITVNNLIFFQQFQAYLKNEKFDKSKAKEIALNFERKWK